MCCVGNRRCLQAPTTACFERYHAEDAVELKMATTLHNPPELLLFPRQTTTKMATTIETSVVATDVASERRSESEGSSNTAFDEKHVEVSEKVPQYTSTGDPIYEPVAELDLIKPIISEFIGIAAGLTTVLYQVAHPVVGRGVGRHSEFSKPGRAQDRAEKTGIYVIAMVFGDETEKAAVRDYVNKMHARVKGGEGPTAYYAKDPKAQLWVAATMYADIIRAYEKCFGPIQPPEKAERVYQEFSYLGTSLQVPPELWPKDIAAFWEYYNDTVENKLEVVPEAKKILYDLLHPWKPAPWHMKPLFLLLTPIFKAVTIEEFHPRIREQYELKSTRTSRFIHRKFTEALFKYYPRLPMSIRHGQKDRYMGMLRQMMERQGIVEYQNPKK